MRKIGFPQLSLIVGVIAAAGIISFVYYTEFIIGFSERQAIIGKKINKKKFK